MEKEVEMVHIYSQMEINMRENGKMTKWKDKEHIHFLMEIHTREAFQTINLMEQEHIKKITIHIQELGKITNIKVKNKN